MKKVIIYTTGSCPYCVKAKMLLNSKKIDFDEITINNSQIMDEMIKKSNGARSVPQIFISDYHVGGCDDLYDLNNKGELDNLLKK